MREIENLIGHMAAFLKNLEKLLPGLIARLKEKI